MPRCQRGGLPHARPKAMGVRRWGGRPAAGRQAAERGLARMWPCANMPPRPAPSLRGGSRADSMVGLTPLTETPAGYRTTCVSREICTQGMCATCNTIAGVNYNRFTASGRNRRHGTWHTQVLDFDCQARHAVILRQHGAAGAERGPGRSRPAQWSRIASGEEQWMSSYMRMQPPAL
jgi:hypothetical protein